MVVRFRCSWCLYKLTIVQLFGYGDYVHLSTRT